MFKNYMKMAFRNTLKYKAYSFINVLGLAIGMTCCLLILVYVQEELSYDRFHRKAARIYRIAVETESSGKRFQYPSIGGGWAQAFSNDFPEVISATRLFRVNPAWLTVEDQRYREERFYFADSTYYDLFDFHFLRGNPETALDRPNSIVLTQETAIKYFGTVSNAFDKRLSTQFFGQELDLQVTGIIENVPSNSHFHFDMMTSLSTVRVAFGQNVNNFLNGFLFTAFYTYFLVEENVNIATVENQLPQLLEKYANEQARSFVKMLFLQPLTGIHLGSNLLNEMQPNSDILYVYIFSAVAILTLFIACINFMNLATARSANRAKEVGLRKVVGAHRKSLINQFIGESTFLAFISLLLAIGLSEFLMPFFNELAGKDLDIKYFDNPIFLLGVVGITLFVGLAAGSYPALFLSAFRPVEVLKGKLKSGSKSSGLRKTLVVIQFGVSIFLIIGIGIIYKQLNFIRNTNLGFELQQRLVIPVPLPNQNNLRVRTVELLKQEYAKETGVVNVASASSVPGQLRGITSIRREGTPDDQYNDLAVVFVDHDYIETMGIELKEGRNFAKGSSVDSSEAFILNEKAVEQLGLDEGAGQRIIWRNGVIQNPNAQTRNGQVIGVIQDMHYEPFHRRIEPMVLMILPQANSNLIVEVSSQDISGTIARLERIWERLVPTRSFHYTFLDDDLGKQYESEESLSNVVRVFAGLAIFIACLGLFGLASFTAEQRTKEIGIRKVLGASVPGVIALLSKEFTKLVVISNLIAWPAAFFMMNQWLQNFYYRTSMGWEWFILGAVTVMAIALLTVSYQAIKAALTNPVEALRYE